MPIIKSASKRMRQQQVRRARNMGYKKSVKATTKMAQASFASKPDSKTTTEAISQAISQIDRAVKKGVFHKNTGARKKSRLVLAYNKAAKVPFGSESANQKKSQSPTKSTSATKAKTTTKKVSGKKPASKD